jgi:DNA-binding LacI/PurR family transcriptional regulator
VEGVIALAPQRVAVDTLIAALRSTPSVFVGGVIGGSADDATPFPAGALPPAIGIDQRGGGAAATRHLLELGHRTVHHLAGPQDYLDALWRTEGWRDTLRAAGAPVPHPQFGDWSARSGHAAMRRLLAADPGLTAVFVGNDQMALGALRALDAAGRAVPGDVSVVGFDDIPEAEFFGPPLTTVRQGFTEAGRRAVAMLMDLISPAGDGATVVEEPLVRTELLVRASTGPAPAGRP